MIHDLQLRRIFSESALAILQKPCDPREILRRQELFSLMESAEVDARISDCITSLAAYRRALELWRNAPHLLSRYFTFARLLQAHDAACEHLAAIASYGELCAEFAAAASPTPHAPAIEGMKRYLLSFSDKIWLTPDGDFADEFDEVAACARDLGFNVPSKKTVAMKADRSLSDAVCRLNADQAAALDAAMDACADFDWYAPLEALPMLEFFEEIRTLIKKAASRGIPHCIPTVSERRQYMARDVYDVTLLSKDDVDIVPNDVQFSQSEPFFFLRGANGGGKTTYLRAVGVNLVLFLAGCPIFAEDAAIYPFDAVLTHFPKDERFDDTGRLDEEASRANRMLEQTGAFLLFNETFSGADEERGLSLLRQAAEKIQDANIFGLYVTHFHKVADLQFPLLTTVVDPTDENRRTYRILRAEGERSSFAADILRKYGLDREALHERRRKR